jgi:hypothetical protein
VSLESMHSNLVQLCTRDGPIKQIRAKWRAVHALVGIVLDRRARTHGIV